MKNKDLIAIIEKREKIKKVIQGLDLIGDVDSYRNPQRDIKAFLVMKLNHINDQINQSKIY